MSKDRLSRIGVVGRGRLGSALAVALSSAGFDVSGPAGRGELPTGDAILLCVPDSEIPAAAAAVAGAAPLIGHTSGATPLTALGPAGDVQRFGLHPLQTFTGSDADPERFAGCRCAVAGSTPAAAAAAAGLDPEEARAALAPLVRATVENWAELGPRRALTGPVARGDELTVATQRAAVREAAPQLEPLFDVMVERARALVEKEALPA